jgi:hypothetical protein
VLGVIFRRDMALRVIFLFLLPVMITHGALRCKAARSSRRNFLLASSHVRA